MEPKIFAAYLPQYHETEINNRFWGNGYTDWVAVKASKPIFSGHIQPKIPLDNNFYDLSIVDSIRWQAKIAKEHHISGFNIYHYWFENSVQALEKPAEILLENKDIDIEFFFSWDNCSWVRSWSNVEGNDWSPEHENASSDGKKDGCLLKFSYGSEKDWAVHFKYLISFFKDYRYLKIANRPVLFFMKEGSNEIKKMSEYWDKLARLHGFDGMYIVTQSTLLKKHEVVNAEFLYQPIFSGWRLRKLLYGKYPFSVLKKDGRPLLLDYDFVWKKILRTSKKKSHKNIVLGGFVNYDDSPRRGRNATIVTGGTPEKFEKYFKKLFIICKKANKEILLITAWNEWGEGAYLEPDNIYKYAYLTAIKKIVDEL